LSTHEYDENMRPDSEFVPGKLSMLIEGNRCRLLDGRRTSGVIEKVFEDSAMFRWRITKYEDCGKHWDLPCESVARFQFEQDVKRLNKKAVDKLQEKTAKFQEKLFINPDKANGEKTNRKIEQHKQETMKWLKRESGFYQSGKTLNRKAKKGSKELSKDLKAYLQSKNLLELEEKTAEGFVLNPNSGEWIKGMAIVLAEMGLVSYNGTIPRTGGIFRRMGEKNRRKDYLIHRLAFNRAFFELQDIQEISVYRGMSTESEWKTIPRTFLSCTLNPEVAKDFASFERESRFKNAYLLKWAVPVEQLFMTFFETEAFNRQYLESEALVLYEHPLQI